VLYEKDSSRVLIYSLCSLRLDRVGSDVCCTATFAFLATKTQRSFVSAGRQDQTERGESQANHGDFFYFDYFEKQFS
jgi:hypothetical protein